jgi:hypothetical protein
MIHVPSNLAVVGPFAPGKPRAVRIYRLEDVAMTRVDLKSPEQLLRLGYGLVPIAAGADKFTNLLTHWEQYLDPKIARALPMKPATFMKLVGAIEIGAGVLVLTRFRRQAAYIVSGWLAAITGNLLMQGRYLDVAARDALLSLSAFAFARLEEEVHAGERLGGPGSRALAASAAVHSQRQPQAEPLVH